MSHITMNNPRELSQDDFEILDKALGFFVDNSTSIMDRGDARALRDLFRDSHTAWVDQND